MKVDTIKFQNKFLKITFVCLWLTDPRKTFAFFSLSQNNLIFLIKIFNFLIKFLCFLRWAKGEGGMN